jgi:hypothetical protein
LRWLFYERLSWGSCRPSGSSQRPLFRFSHATAPARLATPGREIFQLWARFDLGIQPPWPARTASLRATLEHSEISELQFSQFSGGATVERIPGFGSGSVREIFGHGFYNRLIVFGFTNVIAQIRGKISEIDFGYVSGETPIEKCRRANSLRFLNLKGRRRAVPCIFSPLLYRLSYLGLECGSAY